MSPEVVHSVLDVLHEVPGVPEVLHHLLVIKPPTGDLAVPPVRQVWRGVDDITETVDVTSHGGQIRGDRAVALLVRGAAHPSPHVRHPPRHREVVGARHV